MMMVTALGFGTSESFFKQRLHIHKPTIHTFNMKELKLLKISLFPDSNFGIEDRNPQLATPAHAHDFNELSFVFAGSATHVVDGAEYSLKREDIFILRGDRVHEIKNANNFHLVNLIFDRQHFLSIGKEFY